MRKIHAERPSVVVCDLIMPEQEGTATIREIRRLAPQMYIVAISGSLGVLDEDHIAAVKSLGANAALAKPFRAAELLSILAQGAGGRLV
jgi:CheY-like chemotaxis protein